MNKLILVLIFTLTLYATALAQSNQTDWNTFTITTYYPAPYGVYRNMRLQPSDLPSAGVGPGVMYYNQTENMMKFYNGSTWLNMTGGGGDINNLSVQSLNLLPTSVITPGAVCSKEGTLYYDDITHTFFGCAGAPATWKFMSNMTSVATPVNSATGKTCNQICSANNFKACTSIGTDAAGTNHIYAGCSDICSYYSYNGTCATVMPVDFRYSTCTGIMMTCFEAPIDNSNLCQLCNSYSPYPTYWTKCHCGN